MKWPWQTSRTKQEPFRAELPITTGVEDARLDLHSETWRFIRTYCETRLQGLRETNDSPALDEVKTATVRGQIRALKEILDLPKPKPEDWFRKQKAQSEEFEE